MLETILDNRFHLPFELLIVGQIPRIWLIVFFFFFIFFFSKFILFCRPKVENKVDEAQPTNSNFVGADSSAMKYVSFSL